MTSGVDNLERRLRAMADRGDDADWEDVVRRAHILEPDRHAVEASSAHARTARRHASRRSLLTVGVATFSLVVAVFMLLPRLIDQPSLVDDALAAVSGAPVVHAVVVVPMESLASAPGGTQFSVIDLATGDAARVDATIDIWFDGARNRLRERGLVGSRVMWDLESIPSDPSGRAGDSEAAFAALVTGYRAALEAGIARPAGRETFAGREVEWIRFPASDGDSPREVGVDVETHDAIALRSVCDACSTPPPVYEIVKLEAVEAIPPSATSQMPQTSATATVVNESSDIETIGAVYERKAYWPGRSVQGHVLTRGAVVEITPDDRDAAISRGLVLFYEGSADSVGGTISQARDFRAIFPGFNFNLLGRGRPLTRGLAPVPPSGYAAISQIGDSWIAQLFRDGVFVEVNGRSREFVVQAARSLRAMP